MQDGRRGRRRIGALATGAIGGALNGWLIARWSLPPLMVTLGSLSLFRGLAEGLTGGIENYTGLPPGFLALGQGFLGAVPRPGAVAAAGGARVLGRGPSHDARPRVPAIGPTPAASRHAGLPSQAPLRAVCRLGALAGLAAIIYVAHLGQAKADAGTGYELTAITAVVLGGTAIAGGGGTVGGTLIGLTAMVVLQNGLRLAALPAELAGVLTGVLLVGAIGAPRVAALLASHPARRRSRRRCGTLSSPSSAASSRPARASSRAPTGGSCDRFSTGSPDRPPRRAVLPPRPPPRGSSSA